MEISRTLFDQSDTINYTHQLSSGLYEEVVRFISSQNNEPNWMLEKRLEALKIFETQDLPSWGPDL